MFPLKICGAWCLIYTTNKSFNTNVQLQIDYNKVTFSSKEKICGIEVTKSIYGIMRADNIKAKIIWIKTGDYDIDLKILPIINIPYKREKQKSNNLTYKIDETLNIKEGKNEYIFIRNRVDKEETFVRIFMTQLIIDYIIRHLYNSIYNI